jgi:hypothetical protein
MKKKIAFIDYWTKKNTKSSDFIKKIISKEFEITNFWWREKHKIPLDKINKFEYIFFWHVIFPHQIMKKFKNKKIMWAPMYDALNFRNSFFKLIFWKQISSLGIKVLKFSDKITESIGEEDIETLRLNYFMKPDVDLKKKKQKGLNIFFWDRGRIQVHDWLFLFHPMTINKIFYLPRPDYKMKIIKNNLLNKKKEFDVRLLSKKYTSKSRFLKTLEMCNVFIAPRKKEGIGLIIIEAISKGMFIVGYNDSTMNEYIANKKVGFIFDENTNEKLKLNYVIKNYEYRKKYAEINYDKWLQNKKKIIPLLKKESRRSKKIHFYPLFFLDDIKFFLKKIFKINFFYFIK